MYFNNNFKVVESDNILSMHQYELVRSGDDQYVRVLFKLDPALRHYADGEAPFYFALNDGVNVRLVSSIGLPDDFSETAPVPVEVIAAEVPAVAPEAPAASEAVAPEAPAASEAVALEAVAPEAEAEAEAEAPVADEKPADK